MWLSCTRRRQKSRKEEEGEDAFLPFDNLVKNIIFC
jgi:hypothetical protein